MWFFWSTLSAIYILQTQAYDEKQAQRALYFSYGAYCDASELTTWSCKWCQDVTGFKIQSGDVITGDALQAFVGFDSTYNRVTIAFRGTSGSTDSTEIQDWMDNLDYTQESYPNAAVDGHVHSGFYTAWKELNQLGLTSKIQAIFSTYSGYDVLVTGHSLGAAVAQICALELKHSSTYTQTINVGSIHVITFGSPRWCDQPLAKYYNSQINLSWRVVNKLDIVTTVPYTDMGDWGFYHTAQEIRYQDSPPPAYYECDATDGEDEGSWTGGCWYVGSSVNDHLHYFGLEESCPFNSGVGSYIDMDEFDLLAWPSTTDHDMDAYDNIEMCPCDPFTSTMVEDDHTKEMVTSVVEEDEENGIISIYKLKSGLDNVSKITMFVALAVGWLLCLLFLCCWCKTRRELIKQTRRGSYFQLHDV